MEQILITVEEAAELIGVSRSTLYELLSNQEIPSVRINRSIRVPIVALRHWVEQKSQSEHTAGVIVGAEEKKA